MTEVIINGLLYKDGKTIRTKYTPQQLKEQLKEQLVANNDYIIIDNTIIKKDLLNDIVIKAKEE
ncbi:hypothetical protein G8S49_06260 [Clostridium botulinum C]|uniref:Uncharacterized protein n=2 Tax=Clostridium botulinum TaxID=1491 RepID=A0A6G4D9S4_CLOBO|nr:hypothetical protein [Clostridium botulinum]MCD3194770.1 hypothetical protein [Clostridium botulinum C]MCD3200295.1 hypothetical protein [Clostridium botulinum C]MCD3205638.1 hypothetical protein [Clostridium botulinum C]MCD3207527.1 hypothetical protein [Clostridium botulinum C]MCD3226261.1 hypothetical protein [Clostridium botulinum C]